MQFLLNTWYMAAWSDEVGDALLRRRIIDIPIVFFRRTNGSIAALEDRCPHRFAPLSRGTREGDAIRCGYHGLTFDAGGTCIRNPFADRIPAGAHVRAFPTQEQHGIVWVWTGDQEVDQTTLPDFESLLGPNGLKPICGYLPMRANYEFGTDNLMDLSHIEFVHTGTFAGAGVIFAGKHEARESNGDVHSNWWMPNVRAPAHTFDIYPRDLLTDHWLDMHWRAPATMLLEVGATPAGGKREEGVIIRQAHILTPETQSTTHYFWSTTRTTDTASLEGDAMLKALMTQAFEVEDKPMIEAAYENLDGKEFWDQKPVFLGVDTGGSRARRVLQRLIAAERRDQGS